MKAVIYARYSSDSQREESIEGQIRECTAFAEKNGITVLRHYIDRAFSAKTDNRPEFQNMIKDSNKKLFDTVIVWKLDRFARNRYDSARHKATLKKNGVKVVSATEAIADGSVGIMMETILEGMAEYYSVDLSEKVVRGMTDNALKCMFNGGTKPIGYIIDKEQHFQIDPVTSPFVLAAFEKYADGATMTEIRDYLNENGITNTRGKPMTYNSVQHLLNNRRYIGEYVYREIVVPDGIPAIVPLDLFERVQEKMAKNKKAPARHKAEDDYLLTTKLFCGHCGAYMCGESGTSRTGLVHHYYKCVSVKKKRAECHKKPVKKRWIEDLVVAEAMKMVMDDDVVDAIISMLMDLQGRENTNLPLYQQQLRETETKIENLLKAITEGVFTKSTKTLLEELEAAKEELENRIALEKLEKPQISEEFMRFWLHRFRKLDMAKKEHRQMLIDVFINAIFLYDDKMLITFNYKEGTQTITFHDVKNEVSEETFGSDLDCSSAPAASCRLQDRVATAKIRTLSHDGEVRIYFYSLHNKRRIPINNKFICNLSDNIAIDNIYHKKSIAYFICGEFEKGREYIEKSNNLGDNLFVSLLIYADKNFRNRCLLRDAAASVGYDYAYISKFFKSKAGISFRQYVNFIRIKESKYLLSSSTNSIETISEACGFSSLRAFDREFHVQMGMTPSDYKKEATKAFENTSQR